MEVLHFGWVRGFQVDPRLTDQEELREAFEEMMLWHADNSPFRCFWSGELVQTSNADFWLEVEKGMWHVAGL